MPPIAQAGVSHDGDLLERWRQRNRCASASAWIYHVGLDAFAAGEHLRHGPTAAAPFIVLLLRDIAIFQTMLRAKGGTATTTRVAIALAGATDLLAARVVREGLPIDAFETDRAISQFGLSGGWALQLGANRRRGDTVAAYVTPIAMQLALSAIWGLRGGRRARYLAREGAWSVIAVACVSQLSRTMREAVDNGFKSAEARNALFEIDAKPLAEDVAKDEAHHLLNAALPLFAHTAEALARRQGVPPVVASLARAEAQRRRQAPDHGAATVEVLALRLLAARDGTTKATWHQSPGDAEASQFTRRADRHVVDWLTEAAASATGDLVVETRTRNEALEVVMRAASFGPPRPVPDGVELSRAEGSAIISAALALKANHR